MKKNSLIILCFILYISCGKSDNPFEKVKDNYTNTILSLNKGSQEAGNFSIDAINNSLTDKKKNIYTAAESTANSIGFLNDKAYILKTSSNSIEVVNRYTFDYITSISDQLQGPLNIAFYAGKAYVTNAAKNSITIFDVNNNQFIKEIDIKGKSEHIVVENNKIYVQKKGSEESIDNEIVVIDATTDEIKSTIKVQDIIQGMVSSAGFVYAISSIETRTNYYKINTLNDKVFTYFGSTKVPNGQKLNLDRNTLYYVSNENIYSWNFTAKAVDTNPIFTIDKEEGYGILSGFGVIKGNMFIAYYSNSEPQSNVVVYNLNGEKKTTFKTGIATSNFYAN